MVFVCVTQVQYKEITDDRSKNQWMTLDEDIPDDRHMHEVIGLKPGKILSQLRGSSDPLRVNILLAYLRASSVIIKGKHFTNFPEVK